MKYQHHFILDEHGEPKPVDDVLEWARMFENSERRIVEQEEIGDCWVSTVFLGLNHQYNPDQPPLIWETMVFKNHEGQELKRCGGSREQAEAMHAEMIEYVKNRERA